MEKSKRISLWEEFADSPSVLNYLEKYFKDEGEVLQRRLLAEVDESDFSLHQWMEALIVLSEWLEVRGLLLFTEDHFGYVSCAAAIAGSGEMQSHLPTVVHDFLNQYGCERAVKK